MLYDDGDDDDDDAIRLVVLVIDPSCFGSLSCILISHLTRQGCQYRIILQNPGLCLIIPPFHDYSMVMVRGRLWLWQINNGYSMVRVKQHLIKGGEGWW